MSIKIQIETDFINAYKAKDEQNVSLLRLLKSAIKNAEINLGHELSDDEAIKILRKEVKQREDAILEYQKGNRGDLIQKDQAEIEIIKKYLPAEADRATIEKAVRESVTELNAISLNDLGKVIGASMKKLGGAANGNTVSEIAREILKQK